MREPIRARVILGPADKFPTADALVKSVVGQTTSAVQQTEDGLIARVGDATVVEFAAPENYLGLIGLGHAFQQSEGAGPGQTVLTVQAHLGDNKWEDRYTLDGPIPLAPSAEVSPQPAPPASPPVTPPVDPAAVVPAVDGSTPPDGTPAPADPGTPPETPAPLEPPPPPPAPASETPTADLPPPPPPPPGT